MVLPVNGGKDGMMQARNARIGLILFLFYCGLYAGFVLTNTFAVEVMEKSPFAGLNLALLGGFGLIVAAFLLALLYGWLCRSKASPDSVQETQP